MTHSKHEWARPLKVRIGDETTSITSAAVARDLLLIKWPGERTDLHKVASEACLAAMEGADPEVAWLAFLEVAVEAGIYAE